MTVFITLTTAGTNAGPFNLYSDLDGYTSPFEVGVLKTDLEAGYSSILVPDFTSTIRVKSTSEYCINYIDIPVEELPCTRPEGLLSKAFNHTYTPDGGSDFNFTDSFGNACIALNLFNTSIPSGDMEGRTNQASAFTFGNQVYRGLSTDCVIETDGFYITNLGTGEITEILGGVINSVSFCTTTTTTTSSPTTTTTTTL